MKQFYHVVKAFHYCNDETNYCEVKSPRELNVLATFNIIDMSVKSNQIKSNSNDTNITTRVRHHKYFYKDLKM